MTLWSGTRFAALLFWAAVCGQAAAQGISDAAVGAADEDLREALKSVGSDATGVPVNLDPALGAQEYEWRGGELRAGSPLAAAFGLERLAWLARSTRSFPVPAHRDFPALPHRFLTLQLPLPDTLEGPSMETGEIRRVTEQFRAALRDALRFGYNHVIVLGLENFVPWEDPVYGARSERYLAYLRPAIAEAHRHHLKILLMGDEAVYLPSELARRGASASVADPRFWDALQEKYRRLFRAVPDLDGVGTRVGEIIPKLDFRALDLIHSPLPEPNPRLQERYRQFVTRMHAVVAGEFGKIFYHRNWVVNDWEQHSVPAVYRDIYTPDVPAKNLFVSIKLTKQDQWYYGSAFNPTFGQTAHTTVAEGEIYSNYHGSGTIVDFPARWYGAALQHAFRRGAQGVFTGRGGRGILSDGILYVFSRLAWEPQADVAGLTREWAAAAFGPAAAADIAEILLMSADASRHGFYLPPVSLSGWQPLPYIRVNQFVLPGNPRWDMGRPHDEFLRSLYLMCKPYYEDTYEGVGRGHEIALRMRVRFEAAREHIETPPARDELDRLLRHGEAVLALTRDYVRTFMSYFAYREQPTSERRRRLGYDAASLRASAADYRVGHSHYDLAGADQMLALATRMLDDREQAERILRDAPTPDQVAERFRTAQEEGLRLLAASPNAEKVMTWKGTVDGREILHVKGSEVRIEHLAADPIRSPEARFTRPIPRQAEGRWVVRPIQARGVVHLMEQPSSENDYTASIYLEDPQPGSAVFEFELFWIR